MYRFVPLLLIIALAACAPAPSPQEREADYRSDLRRLVQVSLTERLRPDLKASYWQQVTALLPADPPPSETAMRIVDEEIDAVLDQKMDDLEARLMAVYELHFTPDEIRRLLSFHESKVGRKSRAVSAEISRASHKTVQEWTGDFEQTLLKQLLNRFAGAGIEFEF